MKRTTTLLAGLLLPLAGGCAQPSDLYQRATVVMVDEQICVSVAGDSGDRSRSTRVAGVTLSRVSGDRTEAVWELDFTGADEPFFLVPGKCLRPGAPHGDGVVEVLLETPVTGVHYALSIMGTVPTDEPGGDGLATRLYRENFCLKQQTTSVTSIVPVPWGAGRPQWEVCAD
ncbi:hypothetical protein [Novilysobacter erysipheiresistens]|uniref:Lipoprotein n=1 Tax=Novilysobacter erysipheiresistens TaxID=1749332 RepID=A0ABU7YVZ0_9GAMM